MNKYCVFLPGANGPETLMVMADKVGYYPEDGYVKFINVSGENAFFFTENIIGVIRIADADEEKAKTPETVEVFEDYVSGADAGVRCRDCMYYDPRGTKYDRHFCTVHGAYTDESGFCNLAKKKPEGKERG